MDTWQNASRCKVFGEIRAIYTAVNKHQRRGPFSGDTAKISPDHLLTTLVQRRGATRRSRSHFYR